MTYPPNQPPFGSDPGQPGGSPYGSAGQPPYGPSGGSPYGPPSGNPYGPPSGNPYGQPSYGASPYESGGAAGGPPPDYKGWAIAAIFLCWPFAIPAFMASGKVSTLWAQGDMVGAGKASADAKKWGSIGVYVGIGLNVLMLTCACILLATGALSAEVSGSTY